MILENRDLEGGSVQINNEVVAIISAIASGEVDGVVGMGGGFSLAEVFGLKAMNKGVRVEVGQGEALIDVFIITEYGRNIPEIASLVQQNVKHKVETMTGLNVLEVNVIVEGVQMKRERRKSLESSTETPPEYQYRQYP